jgi:ABC-type nitrate/sulfonate/bicarbonate transport system substrate-binding protein
VTLADTSDAEIAKAFAGSPEAQAVVTWNPQLAEVQRVPGSALVFDSKQIAGEIIDMMVVNTKTLSEHPEFGKALAGAWYEVLATMRQRRRHDRHRRHGDGERHRRRGLPRPAARDLDVLRRRRGPSCGD